MSLGCNHWRNSHLEYKKYFASRIKAQKKKNHVKNTKFYKPRNSFLAVTPTPSLPLSFWRLEKKLWWQGTLRWRLFLRRLHSANAALVPRRGRSSRPRGWPSAAVLPIGLWPRLLYRGHRGRPSTMVSIMYFCPKSQNSKDLADWPLAEAAVSRPQMPTFHYGRSQVFLSIKSKGHLNSYFSFNATSK